MNDVVCVPVKVTELTKEQYAVGEGERVASLRPVDLRGRDVQSPSSRSHYSS
jgi:hypothetical protein